MQADPSATAELSGPAHRPKRAFLALALGSAGVVYGDIGTSPLYAFKESIAHMRTPDGLVAAADVLGVVSLMLWSLMVIVTLKYVFIVMRFDNRGEGGTLSLMAAVQRVGGRGAKAILLIGMLGAGLFFGDAVLTPAISVLSAIEGLSVIEGVGPTLSPFVVPIALAVLVALFVVQKHGSGRVGRWFGPICLVWFAVIALLGLSAILKHPEILWALDPRHGGGLLIRHPAAAPVVLGAVFLTVTGAEALYADMGHFGRKPIQAAWMAVVFPCLTLNYLGQGALVLGDTAAAANPFFLLAPGWFQAPLVLLATAATVIASQAVISGAFSLSRQAVQLGLLPRLTLTPTSEDHEGQVYSPEVNWLLMFGVAALVITFGSSTALASAYGMSVVGAMITSSVLAVVAIHRLQGRPAWQAMLVFAPFLAVELAFLGANLMKIAHGGYVPLLIAGASILVMASWMRGARKVRAAEAVGVGQAELIAMLTTRPSLRARGTAVYLTARADGVSAALLHNLKHNQVLHERVILLTVEVSRRPRVPDGQRLQARDLTPGVCAATLTFGFMETPDVAHALAAPAPRGLALDMMRTSFFLSRRSLILRRGAGPGRLQDLVFAFLLRNAARAADYFQLPPARVVELGAQVRL